MKAEPFQYGRGVRVRTRRCAHCGGLFPSTRKASKFCRPSCRSAYAAAHTHPRLPFGDETDALFAVRFE